MGTLDTTHLLVALPAQAYNSADPHRVAAGPFAFEPTAAIVVGADTAAPAGGSGAAAHQLTGGAALARVTYGVWAKSANAACAAGANASLVTHTRVGGHANGYGANTQGAVVVQRSTAIGSGTQGRWKIVGARQDAGAWWLDFELAETQVADMTVSLTVLGGSELDAYVTSVEFASSAGANLTKTGDCPWRPDALLVLSATWGALRDAANGNCGVAVGLAARDLASGVWTQLGAAWSQAGISAAQAPQSQWRDDALLAYPREAIRVALDGVSVGAGGAATLTWRRTRTGTTSYATSFLVLALRGVAARAGTFETQAGAGGFAPAALAGLAAPPRLLLTSYRPGAGPAADAAPVADGRHGFGVASPATWAGAPAGAWDQHAVTCSVLDVGTVSSTNGSDAFAAVRPDAVAARYNPTGTKGVRALAASARVAESDAASIALEQAAADGATSTVPFLALLAVGTTQQLALAPPNVALHAVDPATAPPEVAVQASATASLLSDLTVAGVVYAIGEPAGWLAVTADAATRRLLHTATLSPADLPTQDGRLAPGTYHAWVTVDSADPGMTNTPLTYPVELEVATGPGGAALRVRGLRR